ncbi:oligosaccharide flippase family protein [Patescibacteria group bacterium]|nr:oligosaccharide flippase family protein [Patescibacteria group bacterium]MBU0776933.1 oligosaccharide flippase family protein [Patescibacteria group bacterium]MBU0922512.1 oligosaccharide flippase family protein [Patescibacteria group bacterium]MBU1066310.1 oligosaccharide flippase family protein [Patescibacteria group bacterium]MBU1845152.1 oligosaccharide flippase family protein [Patescibacteria group bacterium]
MPDLHEQEHLDPTAEITLEAVKKRAVKGVVVLTGRTFLLSVLSLVATGFLTVFLEPSEFGIFWIVSAIVNFLAYFSDVGLAAALIQKKERITDKDLKTTFTIQQGLVLILLIVLFLATPLFTKIYGLSFEGKLLLYSLGISLFFSSLKTIPSVLLERELDFGKLVIPQVLENLAYNLVAVFLAWKGFGIRSFTYAVFIRGIVGLVAIYVLRPWMPGFALSKKSLKKLLTFGLPYQLNTFLATMKDDGMTVFLGGILGTAGIGFLGWAQKWAYMPLRLFMDNVLKVTFPAFSRMQDEREHLKRSVTRSIFFVCFLVFPSVVGLVILSPILVEIIPRYDKWEPALIPLFLISINTVFAAATTQLTNLLNAIGKIKTTFKLMIMWTVLTWVFIPVLAIKYGVNGAALGYALVGSSSIIAIYIVRRHVKFSLIEGIFRPAFAAALMGVVLILTRKILPVNLYSIGLLISLGFAVYVITIYLLVGPSIISDAKKSFSAFFSR